MLAEGTRLKCQVKKETKVCGYDATFSCNTGISFFKVRIYSFGTISHKEYATCMVEMSAAGDEARAMLD